MTIKDLSNGIQPPGGWGVVISQPDFEWLNHAATQEHRATGGQIATIIEGALVDFSNGAIPDLRTIAALKLHLEQFPPPDRQFA